MSHNTNLLIMTLYLQMLKFIFGIIADSFCLMIKLTLIWLVPLLQTIEYFELHILAIFFSSFKQNSPLVTISFF